MRPLSTLACGLTVLACGSSARAADAGWQAIIAAGGNTAAEGEAALATVKKLAVRDVADFSDTRVGAAAELFGEGFPKLVRSQEVAGLKPGFFVVIAGYCDGLPAAEAARDLLRLHLAGVYLRPTQPTDVQRGPAPCPASVKGEGESQGKVVASFPADAAAPTLKWFVLAGRRQNDRTGYRCQAVVVELRSRSSVLRRREWIDDCVGRKDTYCIEVASGCERYAFGQAVTAAGRTFLVLDETPDIRHGDRWRLVLGAWGGHIAVADIVDTPKEPKPATGDAAKAPCGFRIQHADDVASCIGLETGRAPAHE